MLMQVQITVKYNSTFFYSLVLLKVSLLGAKYNNDTAQYILSVSKITCLHAQHTTQHLTKPISVDFDVCILD